ncbi:hypothetical protein ACA910_013547 [Epithemia clementina (nom. ined.)]
MKRPLSNGSDSPAAAKLRCVASPANGQILGLFANGQLSNASETPSTVVAPRANEQGNDDCETSSSDYSSYSESGSDQDENDVGSVWQTVFSQTDSVTTSATSNNSLQQYAFAHSSTTRTLQRANFQSSSSPTLGFFRQSQQEVPRHSSTKSLVKVKPIPKPQPVAAPALDSPKPDEFLRLRLSDDGYTVKTFPSSEINSFFQPVTDETVEGYDLNLVTKVRQEDVDGLRELMKSGRSMQCSNQFGESIVHMACRREAISVLRFLFTEANVSCKLVCDSGRTPLHDACWTSVPNFEVIRMLLERCPDLLYITDKRGFTPMNYVRPSNWGSWCEFLKSYDTEKLIAKELWQT